MCAVWHCMLIQVFLSFFLFSYQQVAPGACGEDRQRPRRLPRALQRIPREVRRMDTDTEPPDPTVWAQAIRTQRREEERRKPALVYAVCCVRYAVCGVLYGEGWCAVCVVWSMVVLRCALCVLLTRPITNWYLYSSPPASPSSSPPSSPPSSPFSLLKNLPFFLRYI